MAYIPERKLREEQLGGISKMTLYRWRQDGFPAPSVINRRNYWTDVQIEKDIPAWFAKKMVSE